MIGRGPSSPFGTFSHLRREKAARLMRLLPCAAWEKVADRPDEGLVPRVPQQVWKIIP